jgi:hypothetical protein
VRAGQGGRWEGRLYSKGSYLGESVQQTISTERSQGEREARRGAEGGA